MRANQKYLVIIAVVIELVGCGTYNNVGISRYTGFIDLPFPSNSYAAGQIVEIHTSPKKVEIAYDPRIAWDATSLSDGWAITADATSTLKADLQAKISDVVNGSATAASSYKVKVSFTDVKTRIVEKLVIYDNIKKSLSNNQSLAEMIKAYRRQNTHFDVVTQTLSAKVSFALSDSAGATAKVDPTILQRLNTSVGAEFSWQSDENVYITGGELVIGIHYDPDMIDSLLPK
jgi:hypothetical protein